MSQENGSGAPAPLRIFLVENHDDTLLWLSRYLEMMGHAVVSARTRGQALDRLPKSGCDVLISDIFLPDGDGRDLLKAASAARPLYAIAMSGFGSRADRESSLAAGFRHHLVKPFDPDILDDILEEAARELGRQAAAGCH